MKNYKYVVVDGKINVMDDPNVMVRHLDIDGNLIDKKFKPELSPERLLEAYKWMVLSRQQDLYMLQLQRQGRMLTFAPNLGEEALQVATAFAMDKKKDWFLPAFRSNAAMLALGVPVLNQMLYWNGNENGAKTPTDSNVVPVNIVIASQISHCAGVAYGLKHQKTGGAAVTFIGNGGTTEGEFAEGVNFAAVQEWPAVFCVNNNQWAISTPNHLETISPTISGKAHAFGCAGVRVDGNDFLASYEVIKEAIDYAKNESKPVIVEFITWRQGPHTTSDNPRIYRTEEQEKEQEKWEPMHRFEKYLKDIKVLTDEQREQIWEESLTKVKATYEEHLKIVNTDINDIFDYTYATLTPDLKEQKEEAIKFWSNKGGK
ncbi:pyruvate dehydrogenase (acetyl-transferring) E1 component subunit alpha [Mycoplasmopsis anatis]|uniref:Pyruvate dehydrogenase E1 component subunit alpha n=1 Tax=Mycoplasmopsis anatis TaxID=171279 RepID=A0A9Q3L8G5_9BACT|nr:pyruvate dehydrogenase (acetyl-transferring) E1 component subunit alpha [Mycoplasmopsis anatis]MBW0594886.1 pyruvate dehydrogenase (acetyl-transferring) E1 component subunit alpha [Mycoplasmopsis anatis]MBW0595670.1 pyruvate dehydrogenase (acetyl-transferring) E1 component subunit alpha [Mycoplasmopsis anatis]MBW0595969.1 pyruvate dehydrogenase (acetyl-transferring) E1 component subunit alpha [Mycoplasmopsis anatis]MBW0596688.1 pyruvate dehydrogenase (acetyl-transferring) E1 component subuni